MWQIFCFKVLCLTALTISVHVFENKGSFLNRKNSSWPYNPTMTSISSSYHIRFISRWKSHLITSHHHVKDLAQGLTFHQISVCVQWNLFLELKHKQKASPGSDIKIRLESCCAWRDDEGRADVQWKGFPRSFNTCQLSHKSHGNGWQRGERSSADHHYRRTWHSDVRALNRLCQSHNHRNQ